MPVGFGGARVRVRLERAWAQEARATVRAWHGARAEGARRPGAWRGRPGGSMPPQPAGRAVRGAPALAFRAAPRPCPRANVPSAGTVAHCSPARPGLGAAPPDLHALQSQRVKVRSAPRYSSPGGGPPGPPRQALCVSARPAGPPATCQPGPQRRRPSPMLIKLAGPAAAAPRSFPPTLPTPPGLWGASGGLPGRLCLSALASPRPPNWSREPQHRSVLSPRGWTRPPRTTPQIPCYGFGPDL